MRQIIGLGNLLGGSLRKRVAPGVICVVVGGCRECADATEKSAQHSSPKLAGCRRGVQLERLRSDRHPHNGEPAVGSASRVKTMGGAASGSDSTSARPHRGASALHTSRSSARPTPFVPRGLWAVVSCCVRSVGGQPAAGWRRVSALMYSSP